MTVHPLEAPRPARLARAHYTTAPPRNEMTRLPGGFLFDTLITNPGCEREVVFLHGLGGSPEGMLMLEWLAARHNVTVLAPHLPCHGRTSDVATYSDFIGRIVQWCEHFGLSQANMIGHSLGALTLLYLADSRPDLVSAGICLAMPTTRPARKLGYHARLAILGADVSVTTSLAMTDALFTGYGRQLISALALGTYQGARVRTVLRMLRGAEDVEPVVRRQSTPIEFIYGGADIAIRPPGPDIAPHMRCQVLPGQPHCFPMLRTNWKHISAAFDRALNPSLVPAFAPVITLPRPRLAPA